MTRNTKRVVDTQGTFGDVRGGVLDAEFAATCDEYPNSNSRRYQRPENRQQRCLAHADVMILAAENDEVDEE